MNIFIRIMGMFLVVGLVICVMGQSGCPPIPSEPTTNGNVTVKKIKVNESFVIELKSNPTTGYSWKADFDEEYLSLAEPEYIPNQPELIGSGGVEKFTFKSALSDNQWLYHSFIAADCQTTLIGAAFKISDVCSLRSVFPLNPPYQTNHYPHLGFRRAEETNKTAWILNFSLFPLSKIWIVKTRFPQGFAELWVKISYQRGAGGLWGVRGLLLRKPPNRRLYRSLTKIAKIRIRID
jgi:predicted secreted protein